MANLIMNYIKTFQMEFGPFYLLEISTFEKLVLNVKQKRSTMMCRTDAAGRDRPGV